MTVIEEKSLKAQVELLKGIVDADNMIIHQVQTTAQYILQEVINQKLPIKEGQENVELTIEDFKKIRTALEKLSSNEGFGEMNAWINEKYIKPKEEKKKILSMLQ